MSTYTVCGYEFVELPKDPKQVPPAMGYLVAVVKRLKLLFIRAFNQSEM